jgi:excinuclease ABC subunit A
VPAKRRKGNAKRQVEGCQRRAGNNLKNVSAEHPAGHLHLRDRRVGRRQVHPADRHALQGRLAQADEARENPAEHDRIDGLELLDKIIDIDQSPIGRTPRSNPATYTGAFHADPRMVCRIAGGQGTRLSGPGRFSFNVKGGRCETCQGDGVIKIEMHFLPDVYVTCDVCHGKRYNRETLDIEFKGKSIADVLDMTVEEGARSSSARCRRCATSW